MSDLVLFGFLMLYFPTITVETMPSIRSSLYVDRVFHISFLRVLAFCELALGASSSISFANTVIDFLPCWACISLKTGIDRFTCLAQCALIFVMAVSSVSSSVKPASLVKFTEVVSVPEKCKSEFLCFVFDANRVYY